MPLNFFHLKRSINHSYPKHFLENLLLKRKIVAEAKRLDWLFVFFWYKLLYNIEKGINLSGKEIVKSSLMRRQNVFPYRWV